MSGVERTQQYRVLAILAIALLFPIIASAYSVQDAHLTWNEYNVTTIAPNKDLAGVVLRFSLSEDFARCWDVPSANCGMVFQSVDGLTPLVGQSHRIRDRCTRTGDTIACVAPAATLRTADGHVSFVIHTDVGDSSPTLPEATVSLTIDDTTPTLVSIRTGACNEDGSVCYIAANVPSPITATFSDTQASFDWRWVFIGRDGASGPRVTSCDGLTCTGQLITPCQDGQSYTLAITTIAGKPSTEDAQNPIAPSTGQRVVCKTQGPTITNVTLVADGIAGQAVSSGSLAITADVAGGIGAVSALIETHGILGENVTNHTVVGSCTTSTDTRHCSWQLAPLAAGTFTINIKAIDGLGLYSVREERVTVLRLTSPPTTGGGVYTHKIISIAPESLNRMALDLARTNYLPYPLYVTYDLQKLQPDGRLYEQELTSCTYKLPNETNYTSSYNLFAFGGAHAESHVLYPFANDTQRNRLDLQIRATREVLAKSDVFNVRCTVALTVSDGDTLYDTPENETLVFDLKLRESTLDTPGQTFVDKIKREEEKLKGSDQQMLLKLREARATMDGICTAYDAWIGAKSILTTGVELLSNTRDGLLSSVVTAPAAVPVQATTTVVDTTRETTSVAQGITWNGFIRNVCYQVNCRGEAMGVAGALQENMPDIIENVCKPSVNGRQTDYTSETFGRDTTIDAATPIADVCAGIATPNVEDSFVMSALSLCAGGMIYNAGKWQDINCGYLQCLKEQSLSGGSTAICEAAKGHKMCTQFVGELFELPFINIVTNLAENINGIIEALPQYVLKWAVAKACGKGSHAYDLPERACKWLDLSFDVLDYAQVSTRGFDKPMSDNAICLEALCNKPDGDCKLSYNRVEQLTQYTNYLQINTWLKDQQKRTGTTPKKQSATSTLYAEFDAEWKDYCTDASRRCGGDAYHVEYTTPPNSEEINYVLVSNTNAEHRQSLPDEYDTRIENPDLLNEENYATTREMVTVQGVVPQTQADVDEYEAGIGPKKSDPGYAAYFANLQKISTVNALEATRQKLEQKKAQRLIDGKDTASLDNTITQIDVEQQRLSTELEAAGYTWNPTSEQKWTKTIGTTSIIGYDEDNVGVDFTHIAQAEPGVIEVFGLQKSEAGHYICAAACKQKLNQCKPNCGGYVVTFEGDVATVEKDVTGKAGQTIIDEAAEAKKAQMRQLIVSVAVQYLRDKGYLDWLSISYYGDWGIDLVDQSNTYLTKEGWSNNICNDFKYDINDNDDGAVYLLSEQNNAQPVGTFAAEVRELTNDTQGVHKQYVYLLTILVDNPERMAPAGVDEGSWAERNTYQLDAQFLAPQAGSCTASDCPNELDLINGTFKLVYGETFGSAQGPKKAMIVSNVRYGRMCISFDKDFPDVNGKKTYCREIKENTYERGSPYIPAIAAQPGSTGGAAGSTPDNGALIGDLG